MSTTSSTPDQEPRFVKVFLIYDPDFPGYLTSEGEFTKVKEDAVHFLCSSEATDQISRLPITITMNHRLLVVWTKVEVKAHAMCERVHHT